VNKTVKPFTLDINKNHEGTTTTGSEPKNIEIQISNVNNIISMSGEILVITRVGKLVPKKTRFLHPKKTLKNLKSPNF